MPRANRYFLPGHIWHITHRCHQRQFLLKFARDRHRYLYWLFEAKRRCGLCVLDCIVTSNHIHLLVNDTGSHVIAQSTQLIVGRTVRDDRWSDAIAVGILVFVEGIKSEIGGKATHRGVAQKDGVYALRECNEAYNGDFGGESKPLRLENAVFWNENPAARKHSTVRPGTTGR